MANAFDDVTVEKLLKAWDLLKVTPDTQGDELKAAIRKLRAIYHPDKHGSTPQAQKQASEIGELCELATKAQLNKKSVDFQEASKRFNDEDRVQARNMTNTEAKKLEAAGKSMLPLVRVQRIEAQVPEMARLRTQAMVAYQASQLRNQQKSGTNSGDESPRAGLRPVRTTSRPSSSSQTGGGVPPRNPPPPPSPPPTGASPGDDGYWKGRYEGLKEGMNHRGNTPPPPPPPPPQNSYPPAGSPVNVPSGPGLLGKGMLLSTAAFIATTGASLLYIYNGHNPGNLANGWDTYYPGSGFAMNVGVSALFGTAAVALTRGAAGVIKNNWKFLLAGAAIAGGLYVGTHNHKPTAPGAARPAITQPAPTLTPR